MINWKKPAKCFTNRQVIKLKAQIIQLQKEKAQLRLFLHELIEAYYRTVNQKGKKPKGGLTND